MDWLKAGFLDLLQPFETPWASFYAVISSLILQVFKFSVTFLVSYPHIVGPIAQDQIYAIASALQLASIWISIAAILYLLV